MAAIVQRSVRGFLTSVRKGGPNSKYCLVSARLLPGSSRQALLRVAEETIANQQKTCTKSRVRCRRNPTDIDLCKRVDLANFRVAL